MAHERLVQTIEKIFSHTEMSSSLAHYEDRPEQKKLAQTVLQSFQKNAVCLIEAGTGTGKSLGYLVPALLWAIQTGERIIISTHTIPLQEQLIKKEIPLALKILEQEVGVGLAKGMTNYVCEMKLHEVTQQISFLQEAGESIFHATREWAKTQEEPVTRSSLPIYMPPDLWYEIQAENETCLGARCNHFSSCHFFRARKALSDYKIIVVNHHLLLNDLVQRSEANNWEGTCVLPPYSRIIIDEAHHLEEVATHLFQIKVQRFDHLHLIRQFSKEGAAPVTHKDKSALVKLAVSVHDDSKYFEADYKIRLLRHIEFELSGEALKIEKTSENFFESLLHFVRDIITSKKPAMQPHSLEKNADLAQLNRDGRLRITTAFSETAKFQKIVTRFQEHEHACKNFDAAWNELIDLFREKGITLGSHLSGEKRSGGGSGGGGSGTHSYQETLKLYLNELKVAKERLHKQITELQAFFSSIEDPEKVVWIEWGHTKIGGIEISCIISSFDVGKELRRKLFDPMATTILLSATLTTKDDFTFTKERLGISFFKEETGSPLTEAVYPSPFPYKETALLAMADNMPSSEHPSYSQKLEESIFETARAAKGGTLVLFTSYGSLDSIYSKLSARLRSIGLFPMKQGDMSRTQLLESFRSRQNGVLCATDSFWEGVDIPGSALRCVIITKLPFDVPSDPIYQARHEALEKKGLSSFVHYALPRAVVKFKQAFGRLIRRSTDFGVIVCLDSRLCQKSYGSAFLKSIPSCKIWKGPLKELPRIVSEKIQSHMNFPS